jgi:FAD-dependent urate hydroxylase
VVDYALLATGFQPAMRRLSVLDPSLINAISLVEGYPKLNMHFQTSVPGLHILGVAAARDFGPIMRFVCGTLLLQGHLMPQLVGDPNMHE